MARPAASAPGLGETISGINTITTTASKAKNNQPATISNLNNKVLNTYS
jgi:hypothetical protein